MAIATRSAPGTVGPEWQDCSKSEHCGEEIDMSRAHLATYLNDHLAGAMTALEILDHLKEEAADIRPFLDRLTQDIMADRQELVDLMARLNIEQSRIRKAGGWLAERFVEAKLEVD